MADAPLILWFRRDLRLADHPMLSAAAATGRPLVPVWVLDPVAEAAPAAPLWRWGLGVERFADALAERGSRLVLRRGEASEVLAALAERTGASGVWWSRLYDRASRERDAAVAERLGSGGIETRDFEGALLFEPWTIETKSGGPYKVYTPMWRSVRGRDVPAPDAAPKALRPPAEWPASEDRADWGMERAMRRGAEVVAGHVVVGEAAARARLDAFLEDRVVAYAKARDRLAVDGTSGLSENLTYGEIGPRTCWHAGHAALDAGRGDETWLKELAWREFAYHLLHHFPGLPDTTWRPEYRDFPWRGDNAQAEAWRRGRTGVRVVDAAMRELYATGRMHNRGRLVTASYLTKHLMTHWRVGHDWFADCLIDWDVANNALNWQWVGGSGPDASPFFRVFNPETQADRFDPDGAYRRAWIAEGQKDPPATALSFFEAVPRSWGLSPEDPYPEPIVTAAEGREHALGAFRRWREERQDA